MKQVRQRVFTTMLSRGSFEIVSENSSSELYLSESLVAVSADLFEFRGLGSKTNWGIEKNVRQGLQIGCDKISKMYIIVHPRGKRKKSRSEFNRAKTRAAHLYACRKKRMKTRWKERYARRGCK